MSLSSLVEPGQHDLVCTKASYHVSKAGNKGFKLEFRLTDRSRQCDPVVEYLMVTQAAIGHTIRKLKNLRIEPDTVDSVNEKRKKAELFVGRRITARTKHETFNGRVSTKLVDFEPIDDDSQVVIQGRHFTFRTTVSPALLKAIYYQRHGVRPRLNRANGDLTTRVAKPWR